MCAVDAMTMLPMYSKSIMGAMTDSTYRELSVIVCKGLTLLIRSNQLALEDQQESPEIESENDTDPEIQEGRIRDEDLGEEIVGIL